MHFINKLISYIKSINTENIPNMEAFNTIVQLLANNINRIWPKHSKVINIMKYFKVWWNDNCYRDLNTYKQSRQVEDWKNFQKTVKKTKHTFFDRKIEEIANKKYRSWKLMNWVKRRSLPAIKAIQFNSKPYIKLDNL